MHQPSSWRRIPLWIQGIVLNSLPLIAVLLSAGFAFVSNQRREKMEMSLTRHFEMVENLVNVQTTLLEAEAALRGRLLTRRADFRAPYEAARESIPKTMAHIRTIMEGIPRANRRIEKLAAFDALQKLVNARMESLAALSEAAESPAVIDGDAGARVAQNQPLMEGAVKRLSDFRSDEQQILTKRLEEIRSVRQRDYLLIFLSIVVGLVSRVVAMYFFHRRVVRRVRLLTENARKMREESIPALKPSQSADDIEELERELARIGDFLAERRIDS
jgi:CHASE3 domain sensor protein